MNIVYSALRCWMYMTFKILGEKSRLILKCLQYVQDHSRKAMESLPPLNIDMLRQENLMENPGKVGALAPASKLNHLGN